MPTNDSIPSLIQALRNRIEWEQELDIPGYPHREPVAPRVLTETRPVEQPQNSPPVHASPSPAFRNTSTSTNTPPAPHISPDETVPRTKAPSHPHSAKSTLQSKNAIGNQTKAKALSELKFDLEKCTQCRNHQYRKRIVFSDGTMNAELAFVGDAPSKEEELVSLPFLGERGHLLNKIILAIGYRRESSYLCNVMKCTPQDGVVLNTNEVQACGRHLLKQLQLVSPKVVIALGQTAASYLLNTDTPIADLRGRFHSIQNMQIMPTYSLDHMLSTPASKREVWDDMKQVKELLAR